MTNASPSPPLLSPPRPRTVAASPPTRLAHTVFAVRDYDLARTLTSGQTFRWRRAGAGWEGVLGTRWVRLQEQPGGIAATALDPGSDWAWLRDYLQVDTDLARVLASFPDDPALGAAVRAAHGLRLLRQDPWECLASFLLSATKRIVQIEHIVALLCRRFGQPLPTPAGCPTEFAFPTPARLGACGESDLRDCKMGFRAPHLRASALAVASGQLDMAALAALPLAVARDRLMDLPGVGPKIADCVLLFSLGHPQAFPVDVWVARALRQFYFAGRTVTTDQLRAFACHHFGPFSGYAQQYLFDYLRRGSRRAQDGAPAIRSAVDSGPEVSCV